MKKAILSISYLIILIALMSLQLCLVKYEQTILINILTVAYTYSVFAPCHTSTIAILIILIDFLQFLLSGYFGYMTILLTTAAIMLTSIKNNFYNKLFLPTLTILGFVVCQAIMLYYTLNYPINIGELLYGTIINTLLFIALWSITKQPLHD